MKYWEFWKLLFHIFVIYIFLNIYFVTKQFLLPSLEIVRKKVGISQAFAGFFLIGGALNIPTPTLALAGVFNQPTVNNTLDVMWHDVSYGQSILLGVADSTLMAVPGTFGTGLTVLLGMCIATARKVAPIPSGPLIKDLLFVLLTMVVSFVVILDAYQMWWESLIITLLLPLFIFITIITEKTCRKPQKNTKTEEEADTLETGDWPLTLTLPSGCLNITLHLLLFPIKVFCMFTIPDVHRPNMRKLYPGTLVMSLIWVTGLSLVIRIIHLKVSWQLGIAPEAKELLIMLVSVELAASIILARRGEMVTAVHSVLGGMVAKVCLVNGLAILLYNCYFSVPYTLWEEGPSCMFIIVGVLFIILSILLIFGVNRSKLISIVFFLIYPVIFLVYLTFMYGFFNCPIY